MLCTKCTAFLGHRDTYQGKILDGRNRYTACLELGIQPKFQEWRGDGSPTSFVLSENLKRRHLTSSQRAVVSLEAEKMFADEAEERRRELGRQAANEQHGNRVFQFFEKPTAPEPIHAAEKAAAATGTNRQYVSDAKKIAAEAPDLLEKVRDGSLTIPKAKAEMNRREVSRRG